MRYSYVLLFLLLLLQNTLTLCVATANDVVSKKGPNILFAFADDQSWLHTSFNGDPNVNTPNFDRIAREGVSFSHCFSACPSCTPSRSAVLTGQDIWRIKQAGVLCTTRLLLSLIHI